MKTRCKYFEYHERGFNYEYSLIYITSKVEEQILRTWYENTGKQEDKLYRVNWNEMKKDISDEKYRRQYMKSAAFRANIRPMSLDEFLNNTYTEKEEC